jgi:hypothetical protein
VCSSVTRVLDHPDRVSYRRPPLAAAKFLSPSIPYTSSKSALPVLDFRQSAQSRPICSGPGDVPYAGKPTFRTPLLLRSGSLESLKRLELGDDPLAEYPNLLSQIG